MFQIGTANANPYYILNMISKDFPARCLNREQIRAGVLLQARYP